MTSRTNRTNKTERRRQNSRQAGVTLLLALLVLSAILSIAFSIATILFIEIRSSSDLIKTEPAIYGASAVGEEAIFNIKRKACTDNSCYTTQFNNKVASGVPVVTSTTTPILQDRVPSGGSFDSANSYIFYDAALGTNTVAGSNYGLVSVSYLDSGNTIDKQLELYLCEYYPDPTTHPIDSDPEEDGAQPGSYNSVPCTDQSDTLAPGNISYWPHAKDDHILPGETKYYSLDVSQQQTLFLFTQSNKNIYVKIETYGPGTLTPSTAGDYFYSPTSKYYTPKGLPYVGETAVEINVSNASVGRKVRVVVPNPSANNTVSSYIGSGPIPYLNSIVVVGNYLYGVDFSCTTQSGGLCVGNPGYIYVVDISDKQHPVLANSIAFGDHPRTIVNQGNYLYISDSYNHALAIFEIDSADRKVLHFRSEINLPVTNGEADSADMRSLAVSGNYAYVSDYWDRVYTVDVSNAVSPQLKSCISTWSNRCIPTAGLSSAFGVFISGGYLYVANTDSDSLDLFDITSDPTTPHYYSGVSLTPGIHSCPVNVFVSGNTAFVADWDCDTSGEISIVDVTDKLHPVRTSQLQGVVNYPNKVFASNGFLYVVGDKFVVLNASNPAGPTVLSSDTVANDALYVAGGYVYFYDGTNLQIYSATQ